jgi:SAM-dependent MidA family methyltransferase
MTDEERDDPGDPVLIDRIRGAIRSRGRITFAEFMRMALYEPGLGYYMTAPDRFHGYDGAGHSARSGREGDYFTAPELHPLFGQMVGRQVIEMVEWLQRAAPIEVMGRGSAPPDNPHRHTHLSQGDAASTVQPITIIEMGAGRGLMAEDILTVCALRRPARLRYMVVESNPSLAAEQRIRLVRFAEAGIPVEWRRTIEEAASAVASSATSSTMTSAMTSDGLTAIIVSNELVDAFPVHRVVMQGGRLLERYVTVEGDRLVERLDEPSTPALEQYFERFSIRLPDGFQTEVNLEAIDWVAKMSRLLGTGFVLTIDYGHSAEERYAPARREGTLACYAGHRRLERPYVRVGRQDLTAHVDFSALVRAGRESGLELTGFTDQTSFLLGLGAAEAMETRLAACDAIQREVELAAMKMLLAPDSMGGMGRAFKVLIQQKGVVSPRLSGLTFRPFVLPKTFA